MSTSNELPAVTPLPASGEQLAASLTPSNITGVVLAGGQARRMGGIDKGLVPLEGVPLIEHVLARLTPQVGEVLINANRSHAEYAAYGHTLVADREQGYHGPLMGMASALAAARTEWVIIVACDVPHLPIELIDTLSVALIDHANGDKLAGFSVQGDTAPNALALLAVAADEERYHPVICLMHRGLLSSLEAALAAGERKIDRWFDQHAWLRVQAGDSHAFANLNTLEECREMESGSR
ncbi:MULTISPECIES: molybdenum cofactor guanylyltransferase MobA [Cobetia]|uniref:Molybdenum cofactor guanylyltransferase n=1 Tax=Cobetia crustatorum TaxID=553385 RepID=A0A558HNG1_9GAMM|nr:MULTISPECIES: molybdenum cofactor guanylyltransferase MobA [Cobetia]TVU70674.1 molybdenum cofactor guanylyltransferase [Cobetia crustatorum]